MGGSSTLVALLLLAAGQAAAQQWGVPWATPALYSPAAYVATNDSNLRTGAGQYDSSSHASSVAKATMVSGLANLTFRAGLGINFMPPDLGSNNLVTFSSNTAPGYLAWSAAYAAGQFGTAIRIARSDVTGMLPWLNDYVAANTSATFEYYALVLPPDMQNEPDSSLRVLWALENMGMDIGMYDCTLTSYRAQFINFTVPFTFYSHQVVTREAVLPKPRLTSVLWTFLRPFSWDLWLVLLASVFVSGVAFYLLEEASHPKVSSMRSLQFLRYANFIAAMSLVGTNNHEPTTAAGQMFASVRSFVMFILMAAYLANFSAYLSYVPPLYQQVTGFDSFQLANVPACLRNNSIQIKFMANFYPLVQTVIVGPATTDVLNAILDGTCVAGVEAEYHLWYNMGPQVDPTGRYCPLQLVGARSDAMFPYSLPLGPNVPDYAITAFSRAVEFAVYNGDYSNAAKTLAPRSRPPSLCYLYQQSVDTATTLSQHKALDTTSMAGLFIVMGGALVFALVAHYLFEARCCQVEVESTDGSGTRMLTKRQESVAELALHAVVRRTSSGMNGGLARSVSQQVAAGGMLGMGSAGGVTPEAWAVGSEKRTSADARRPETNVGTAWAAPSSGYMERQMKIGMEDA